MKENHWVLMLLTCVLPLVMVFVVTFYFGVNARWLVWVALGICMLSHVLMMRQMHGGSSESSSEPKPAMDQEKKQGGGCH